LTTPVGHEWFRSEAIQVGEPLGDIGEHRLHENTAAGSAHPNTITLKPELARQSHGLTPTIPEKLGGCGHRVAPSVTVYIISIDQPA
jgi:hypothetical protein